MDRTGIGIDVARLHSPIDSIRTTRKKKNSTTAAATSTASLVALSTLNDAFSLLHQNCSTE